MKTNNNNNRNENSNATRAMVASVKAMINAEYLQRVDLVKYGIQVFAAYLDSENPQEYYVVIAAERDIKTGRYYFIDRDGVRIAWSRLNADTLAYACRDFIDQVNADQSTEERADGVTVYNNVTRERLAEICTTIADAVGVLSGSTFPAFDIKIDLKHFDKWTAAKLADDRTDPRAPFFFAVRHQGAESGTLEHIKERCNVLGRPVYVMKAVHATDADGLELSGRYNLAVKVDPQRNSEPAEAAAAAEPTNTNTEAEQPAAEPEVNEFFYYGEMGAIMPQYLTKAQTRKDKYGFLCNLAGEVLHNPVTGQILHEYPTKRNSEPTEPAAAAEPTNTNTEPEQPATEPENEPQSETKAPTTEEPAADYAAGTADTIRRRWQSFKAKAARVALAVAPWLGVGIILGLTLAVFVIAILNVPAWVESLPILPRAFVGCLFIFLPTMGAEMLIIKAFEAIDRRGWFGFNPLAFS